MAISIPDRAARPLQAQLLARLDRIGQQTIVLPRDWALIDQVAGSRESSSNLLSRMADFGSLRRVRKGAYAVRSRADTIGVTALQLVGEVSPPRHLLTAGRALAIHGLSDQAYRRMIVLVSTQARGWEWLGETIHYARVPSKSIWGGAPLVRGPRTTIVATAQRAILDSLAQPNWGVSLSEIVRALRAALQSDRFADTLAAAAARYDNASVSRRLGLLVEHVGGVLRSAPFLPLRGPSHATVLLRPGYGEEGIINSTWNVRQNIDLDLLNEH
jgi:predicted transcriptional regulator of viral defense system